MSKKIYLHVGYPKTATSALQKYIFPNIDRVYYAGKNEGADEKFSIIGLERLLLNASSMSNKDFLQSKIPTLPEKNYPEVILISEEILLFNLFRPTLWCSAEFEIEDLLENIKCIEIAWDVEFHVIVTVRRQVDMIPSIYAQCYNSCYSRIEETKTFDGFVRYFFEGSRMHEYLDYNDVIYKFKNRFKYVDVIVYETSKNDSDGFLSYFSKILNVEISDLALQPDNVRENGGYKEVGNYTLSDLLGMLRHKVFFLRHVRLPFLRKMLHRVKLKSMKSISENIAFTDCDYNAVVEKYMNSNVRLADSRDLNLKSLGYYDKRNE